MKQDTPRAVHPKRVSRRQTYARCVVASEWNCKCAQGMAGHQVGYFRVSISWVLRIPTFGCGFFRYSGILSKYSGQSIHWVPAVLITYTRYLGYQTGNRGGAGTRGTPIHVVLLVDTGHSGCRTFVARRMLGQKKSLELYGIL